MNVNCEKKVLCVSNLYFLLIVIFFSSEFYDFYCNSLQSSSVVGLRKKNCIAKVLCLFTKFYEVFIKFYSLSLHVALGCTLTWNCFVSATWHLLTNSRIFSFTGSLYSNWSIWSFRHSLCNMCWTWSFHSNDNLTSGMFIGGYWSRRSLLAFLCVVENGTLNSDLDLELTAILELS